jgi:hypothetical protein
MMPPPVLTSSFTPALVAIIAPDSTRAGSRLELHAASLNFRIGRRWKFEKPLTAPPAHLAGAARPV